jgi:hypothetical protein
MPRGRKKGSNIGRGDRPLGVLLISVLEIIAAFYVFLGVAAFSSIHLLGISRIVGIVAGFGGTLLLVLGIILLAAAYGLWAGERWGWWLSMVISGFMVLSIALLDIVGFVIGLVLIYYLTRKYVKRWFRLS